MARLLRHLDEVLYAQYGRLCLYGATDCPEFSDEEEEMYHENVDVRLEAWDAEPPGLGPDWRPIGRRSFTAVTGVIEMGVLDDSGTPFLIGPPWFEYGLTVHVHAVNCLRWSLRFWPVRDVFDPLVHARPMGPVEAVSRRVPVPVTTAGQWAAMRPDATGRSGSSQWWPAGRRLHPFAESPLARALNPGRMPTFLLPSRPLHEELDLRDKEPGSTYRAWRWERRTADGRPEDGNLLAGRIVHVRDVPGGRVLASGIVTLLGEEEDGRHYVRDAEPHEAARVLCAEETWAEGTGGGQKGPTSG
ncbi:unnamed protein product [[Actinomadura] parvosata subsp. kistnae]|uniref:Uncharacterized protein n=1 Tax=[Actinomadura] parvosata subsp. kistnae TaxID=1909395 RepID=A0A1V0AC27_9ACTN|nr:hypothetical protein [Nonomuraea sp. ATCC 55076]AQZ67743.1 hypothetical protein BKM31_45370 [Nonomuraea sp. ATCC 55076]SPL93960.1 unnamed protein product [Actinomadura parvosata subsp. kistnae]